MIRIKAIVTMSNPVLAERIAPSLGSSRHLQGCQVFVHYPIGIQVDVNALVNDPNVHRIEIIKTECQSVRRIDTEQWARIGEGQKRFMEENPDFFQGGAWYDPRMGYSEAEFHRRIDEGQTL